MPRNEAGIPEANVMTFRTNGKAVVAVQNGRAAMLCVRSTWGRSDHAALAQDHKVFSWKAAGRWLSAAPAFVKQPRRITPVNQCRSWGVLIPMPTQASTKH